MKKVNFSAGPAILPQEVIKQAAEAIIDYAGTGLSILEVSHRSKEFVATMEKATALVRDLFQLPDNYAVLFLSGGASTQFFMAPMNLLNEDDKAGYISTGSWAKNAIKEAKAFGKINVLASSEEDNFKYIPKNYEIPQNLKYLHLTSNNTIFGTQYHQWPESPVPFVCDMSSDIFSRPVNVSRFDLIYAGAQKNMGPAGVTLVIVKKDILGKVSRYIPTMLKYETHINGESMYNTPPVYAIYVSMLTMQWIKDNGGLEAMAQRNEAKARLIYDEIDRNQLFYGHAVPEDRSQMNVCFRLHDESLEAEFLKRCAEKGLDGLKGHRSVGGFRASIYNAMDLEGIQKLVDLMQDFEKEKA
ncbi:MAG: 3-phosphoserine/phosphohydroxythreonine transaminase [Saprospiraceae bacterium]|nr:3-phosphoserine/phosphohydroxythreonine transaminase [Saprospiraceae bacterium]